MKTDASLSLVNTVSDRKKALSFVRRHVRSMYGFVPLPSQTFFLAKYKNRVCGTISLDLVDSSGKFPLEFIYEIDPRQAPWSFERGSIIQISRWWATRPNVAFPLMYSACMHALQLGKVWGLVEAKSQIVTHVEKFGMCLKEFKGATLRREGLPSRGRNYYQVAPFPKLYMVDLRSSVEALVRCIP